MTPINFWNANQPLEQPDEHRLVWQSVTTGGVSGVILELARPDDGTIEVKTVQGAARVHIESVGIESRTWEYGGLDKKIEVYRLPDKQRSNEFSFHLPLTGLHPGDNPIYIRVAQEDGHLAWTSPVYLVSPGVDIG
jgi:hypothetical protein